MKLDKPDHYDKIDTVFKTIWTVLDEGVRNIKSPFHQGYLATHSNSYPSIRTIVLRNVDSNKKVISFHTDFRSKKVDEIKVNDSISILFYDHDKKIHHLSICHYIRNQNVHY